MNTNLKIYIYVHVYYIAKRRHRDRYMISIFLAKIRYSWVWECYGLPKATARDQVVIFQPKKTQPGCFQKEVGP